MKTSFGQMIAMKLYSSRRQRIRIPVVRIRNTKWLWPYNAERKYQGIIKNAIQAFSDALYPSAEVIAKRWGRTVDGAGDDLVSLQNEVAILSDRFFGSDLAGKIADVGIEIDMFNGEQFNRFSDLAIGQRWDPMDAKSKQTIRDWSLNNYSLAKSLPDEHVKRLNQIITDGVQQGRLWTDIAKDVQGIGEGLSKQKAQFLSRDQIGKLNGALARSKQQDAGVDFYIWQATMDDRTRDGHAAMDGMVCRWDDPTVYSDDGGKTWKKRTGSMPKLHPGEDYQCRCTAAPFFDILFQEAAEEVDKEVDIPTPEKKEPVKPTRTEIFQFPDELKKELEDHVKKLEGIAGFADISNLPYPEIPFNDVADKVHAQLIRKLAQNRPELIETALKAGMDYKRNAARFNIPLRNGMLKDDLAREVYALRDTILRTRITYDICLYRGITHGKWSIGDEIPNQGFSSFSSDEKHARSFLKEKEPKYILRWVAEAGAPVAPLFIGKEGDSINFNASEREFLGVPGMKMIVVGMKINPLDPKTIILDVRMNDVGK